MLFACGFFVLIGTNPQAKLYEFTSAFLSLLALFVPAALLEDALQTARTGLAAAWHRLFRKRWPPALTWALLAALTLYFTFFADRDKLVRAERDAVVRLFYACGLVSAALLLLYTRLSRSYPEERTRALLAMPAWLAIVPLVFALHEASVYAGFKHMPTLTMAGNLRIERGISNHLVVRDVPHLDANRVVILRDSSDAYLRRPGVGMTWLALSNYLAQHPDVSVRFELEGKEEHVPRAGDDPRFQDSSWLATVLTRAVADRPHDQPWTFAVDRMPRHCHHQLGRHRSKEAARLVRLREACERRWRPICAFLD